MERDDKLLPVSKDKTPLSPETLQMDTDQWGHSSPTPTEPAPFRLESSFAEPLRTLRAQVQQLEEQQAAYVQALQPVLENQHHPSQHLPTYAPMTLRMGVCK